MIKISSLLISDVNLERILENFRSMTALKFGFESDMIFKPEFVGIIKDSEKENSAEVLVQFQNFIATETKTQYMTFKVTYKEDSSIVSVEFIDLKESDIKTDSFSFRNTITNLFNVFTFLNI